MYFKLFYKPKNWFKKEHENVATEFKWQIYCIHICRDESVWLCVFGNECIKKDLLYWSLLCYRNHKARLGKHLECKLREGGNAFVYEFSRNAPDLQETIGVQKIIRDQEWSIKFPPPSRLERKPGLGRVVWLLSLRTLTVSVAGNFPFLNPKKIFIRYFVLVTKHLFQVFFSTDKEFCVLYRCLPCR